MIGAVLCGVALLLFLAATGWVLDRVTEGPIPPLWLYLPCAFLATVVFGAIATTLFVLGAVSAGIKLR